MKDITLLLGVHQSQHLGYSDSERDSAYEHIYKPLLKTLYNYSSTRFSIYFAGMIYEWLDKYHSEFVDVLNEMTKRRQIELIGGGFYEPFFPLIPKSDRLGQIERLTAYIRKQFGRRPRGGWVPEGVWDQRIASSLNSGGIEYVFLDGDAIGLKDTERYQPFLTEDLGKVLTVFPVVSWLRNMMFVVDPGEVIEEIKRSRRKTGDSPVYTLFFEFPTMGPGDGEAIEWFVDFLDKLTANSDWIQINTPSRVMKSLVPARRYSLPATRMVELKEWQKDLAGISDRNRATDLRTFRSILDSYPETARLYAKMQYTHVLVNQVRGDKSRKMTAREELWRGQSHFGYWHNPGGGIYRSELRKATYAALLEAEKTTREKGIFIPSILRLDFDFDGQPEVLYQGSDINAYVHLRGASIFELDYLARNWNYLDTMTRREEPYHDDRARTAGYDRWPRDAFVDHLFTAAPSRDDFSAGNVEFLSDLASLPYEVESLDKDRSRVTFAAVQDIGFASLAIRKRYRFNRNRIEVTYEMGNEGMEPLHGIFGSEINLSFYSIDAGNLRVVVRQGRQKRDFLPDLIEADNVSDIQFSDLHNGTNVVVSPSGRPSMWSIPIYAQALLSGGRAWLYQSNSTVFIHPLDLEPGERKEFSMTIRFDPIR